GSRVFHRLLLKLPDGAGAAEADALRQAIEAALPDRNAFEVETYADAQPQLRAGLRRAQRFLGLVALLSLLVGGVGVAQTVRSWLAGRIDAIAVLACLGMRPREIFLLYLGQALVLSLVGSAVGALAGTLLLAAVPYLLWGTLRGIPFSPWQPL